MRRVRNVVVGLVIAAGLAIVVPVYSASVQCGGSFVPTLNCTIPGLWNWTSAVTARGPIPFQVLGTDVTGITSKETLITNAQVLALNTTGVSVVPAPGAGYYVDVIGVALAFNYTGAYTVNANDDLRLYYTSRTAGTAASETMETNGFLTSTADIMQRWTGTPSGTNLPTTNQAVVLQNTSGVAFGGGNAANTLKVIVNYRIVASGL